MTVGAIIGEAFEIHFPELDREARRERVASLLERVGLKAAMAERHPHEFSGGQRQRIGIARALAVEPEFLICDEPVSALDVSVQAQIVNLLQDLQEELGLSLLFIAHDLAVVEHISDSVIVLNRGRIVESGPAREVLGNPVDPYTRELLAAVPRIEP
jgi:peptide/nickel transport system ATP-binding protein/oligopeptide transport system ATP-binding protein